MGFRSLPLVVLLSGIVSACSVVDPVDNRYDTISRSLAKARNESIFLNLIRASHDYPLSFVTIANVTPSMTNTTSLGLPSFLFGPHIPSYAGGGSVTSPLFTPGRDVIFGNTTASNSTLVSTNFSVATQETTAFYEGFLKPIDLETLDYFIRQGYSRELLYWLFTDSVEITGPKGTFGLRYDPPNDYGCSPGDPKKRCFKEFVRIATVAGLTIEETTVQKGGGSGGGGGSKGGGGGASKGDGGESSSGSAKTTKSIYARFCFNPVLAQSAAIAMGPERFNEIKSRYLDLPFTAFNPKCGTPWNPQEDAGKPQPDTFPFTVGPIRFKIVPRSAYGVFEFLGLLIKMQRDHPIRSENVYIPPNREDEELAPPILWTVHDDENLMTVSKDSGGFCFSHSWFYDGDYCVPENAATTKRIFSLLAQLIAIQTSASDLSITPLVRVVQ